VVAAYNPLPRARSATLRIPINKPDFCVYVQVRRPMKQPYFHAT
jgi:hypothetical protein